MKRRTIKYKLAVKSLNGLTHILRRKQNQCSKYLTKDTLQKVMREMTVSTCFKVYLVTLVSERRTALSIHFILLTSCPYIKEMKNDTLFIRTGNILQETVVNITYILFSTLCATPC